MNNSSSTSFGVGLPTLLGVAFIVLKLTEVINWSWFWVLAPFWAPFVILLLVFVAIFIFYALQEVFKKKRK